MILQLLQLHMPRPNKQEDGCLACQEDGEGRVESREGESGRTSQAERKEGKPVWTGKISYSRCGGVLPLNTRPRPRPIKSLTAGFSPDNKRNDGTEGKQRKT